TPHYNLSWNTAGLAGTHTLTAAAYDRAGNTTSTSINVTVIDSVPPTVTITYPYINAWLRGIFTASATASDNAGVARVEFLINGAIAATDTTNPYSVPF